MGDELGEEGMELSLEEMRGVEEELCGRDRERRITRHFWIKRKSGAITLLEPLKVSQRKVLNLIKWFVPAVLDT